MLCFSNLRGLDHVAEVWKFLLIFCVPFNISTNVLGGTQQVNHRFVDVSKDIYCSCFCYCFCGCYFLSFQKHLEKTYKKNFLLDLPQIFMLVQYWFFLKNYVYTKIFLNCQFFFYSCFRLLIHSPSLLFCSYFWLRMELQDT